MANHWLLRSDVSLPGAPLPGIGMSEGLPGEWRDAARSGRMSASIRPVCAVGSAAGPGLGCA